MYYYGARYYDAKLGRWCSADPVLVRYIDGKHNGGIFNTANIDLYSYAYNNPVLYIDPDGNASRQSSIEKRLKALYVDIRSGNWNNVRKKIGIGKKRQWPSCTEFASRAKNYSQAKKRNYKLFYWAKNLAKSKMIEYYKNSAGKNERNGIKLLNKVKVGDLIVFDSKDHSKATGHFATIVGIKNKKINGKNVVIFKTVEGHMGDTHPTSGNYWDDVGVREYRSDYLLNWGTQGANPSQETTNYATGESATSITILKFKGFAKWKKKK